MAGNPAAFDAFAADYDAAFTHTPLGQLLRQRVWRILATYFRAGQTVLELACGTGEDAIWLAQQGISVLATDGASEMVQATAAKASEAKLDQLITPRQLALQEVGQLSGYYDGVLSNFGGLNTLADWRPLAAVLAERVRPGSHLVLVPMGPYCPWEVGWHGVHGEWHTAVRRLRPPATARIGQSDIPIWYPSARRLKRDFAPWFTAVHLESLGLWLPPSYLGHLVGRWPRLFAQLNRLESRSARLTGGWGDHYVLVLRRI